MPGVVLLIPLFRLYLLFLLLLLPDSYTCCYLQDTLDRIVPEGRHYRHLDEGPDDMPAHVKVTTTWLRLLVCTSTQMNINNLGTIVLLLGMSQVIYFFKLCLQIYQVTMPSTAYLLSAQWCDIRLLFYGSMYLCCLLIFVLCQKANIWPSEI